MFSFLLSLPVIRQKGLSQNRCYKKTKHNKQVCARTCAYQGVRNVRFPEKFGVLGFLVTMVLRFGLLPYYRWAVVLFLTLSDKTCLIEDEIFRSDILNHYNIWWNSFLLYLGMKNVETNFSWNCEYVFFDNVKKCADLCKFHFIFASYHWKLYLPSK